VNKLKIQWVSWFLSNPFRIIDKNNGKAPLTYHQFQAIIASMEPPPKPQATITEDILGNARTPLTEDHDERYGVPTLDELGFDTEGLKTPVWIGGETEALGEF
jgi:cryptochrome